MADSGPPDLPRLPPRQEMPQPRHHLPSWMRPLTYAELLRETDPQAHRRRWWQRLIPRRPHHADN